MDFIPSFNLQAIAIRAALVLVACVACWIGGCTHEREAWEIKVAASESLADAKAEGLKHELDHITATGKQVQGFIAAVYERQLDGLRNRPPRRVEVIRSGTCEGVSGAELSGPDSAFLVGEAARAQRILEERNEIADKFNALLARCNSN